MPFSIAVNHPMRSKKRLLKNLIVVSSNTLLLFLAYNGLAMLQSTMNHKDGIGIWSQAILYFSFCISSFLLPPYVIKKLGSKMTYAVSTLLYLPYIASNFYPHWTCMVPASVIIGIAAPLFWGAQATYLNDISILYADITMETGKFNCISGENKYTEKVQGASESPHRTKNFDVEFHMPTSNENAIGLQTETDRFLVKPQSLNCNSDSCCPKDCTPENEQTVLKNQTAIFSSVDRNESDSNFEVRDKINVTKAAGSGLYSKDRKLLIESTTARIFGAQGFVFLSSNIWSNLMSYQVLKGDPSFTGPANMSCECGAQYDSAGEGCLTLQTIEQPNDDLKNLLNTICVCFALFSAVLVFLFLDPLEKKKQDVTFSFQNLMATCKLIRKKKCLLLLPLSYYTGMMTGFYPSDFNRAYVACALGTYNVGLVAVCYGAASGVSSIASGWLVKRVGRIPILSFVTFVNVVSNVVLLFWKPDTGRTGMFFLVAGLLGIYNGVIWSLFRAFYGIIFKGDEEAAFAAFHGLHSLGFGISFACSTYVWNFVKIYLMLALSIVGFACYVKTEKMYLKERPEEE